MIFQHDQYRFFGEWNFAPSPNEDVKAAYYFESLCDPFYPSYKHCTSFFINSNQSYLVRYEENEGIEIVNLVPELGLITKSGQVSNNGKYLDIQIINTNQN